jgi:hypothetical protein
VKKFSVGKKTRKAVTLYIKPDVQPNAFATAEDVDIRLAPATK